MGENDKKGLHDHLKIYDMGQQESCLRWFLLGDFGYYPKVSISLIHALKNTHVMKREAWMRWLLLGEYDYYPKAHIFLSHALCINDSMKKRKECSFGLFLREFVHHMTSPMFMCFLLLVIWHSNLTMYDNGVDLYWDDMKFHMSISMFLLLHDSHYDVKR